MKGTFMDSILRLKSQLPPLVPMCLEPTFKNNKKKISNLTFIFKIALLNLLYLRYLINRMNLRWARESRVSVNAASGY